MFVCLFIVTLPGHLPNLTSVFPTVFIVIPYVIFAKSLPTSIFQYTLISDPMHFILVCIVILMTLCNVHEGFVCNNNKVNPFKTASLLCWSKFPSVTATHPCLLNEHLSPVLLLCQFLQIILHNFSPKSALYMKQVRKHITKCNTLPLESEHAVQIHAVRICKAPWAYEQVWKMLRRSGKAYFRQKLLYYLGTNEIVYPKKSL